MKKKKDIYALELKNMIGDTVYIMIPKGKKVLLKKDGSLHFSRLRNGQKTVNKE